jgi:peptide/nickel transport system ATP-binding protein
MVMQHGLALEDLTRDELRARQAKQGYTRQLLTASLGYRAEG